MIPEYIIRNKKGDFLFSIKSFEGFIHITKTDGLTHIGIAIDEVSCFSEMDKLFNKYLKRKKPIETDEIPRFPMEID